MKMNSNFKNTSIGKIPVDWEDMKLEGIISKFIVPMRDKPKKFVGNIPWCRIEDIEGKYLSDTKSEQYVDETTVKDMNLKIHPAGTVICSCSARLGVCAITTTDLITNQTFIGLVPSKKVDKEFLYYMMSFSAERLQKLSSGTTIAYLSRQEFEKFRIPFPPIGEQQKIASILSTWDKAIELKERLIEQKKEQKKGLMQKLLTGEVRLPGFDGEWRLLRIKDLGTLKGGSAFPEKYQNESSGKYPFYKVSDMNNVGNEKYMLNANNYISRDIQSKIKATIVPKNSIVFAKVGAALLLERKRLLSYDSCIDNNMMALVVNKGIDYKFVYYLFLNMKLSKFSNVGALPSLSAKDVYSLKCKVPVNYAEQTAIAKILSLTDKEIKLLQEELNEIKQQKKGLMQLLLTGKVRVKV